MASDKTDSPMKLAVAKRVAAIGLAVFASLMSVIYFIAAFGTFFLIFDPGPGFTAERNAYDFLRFLALACVMAIFPLALLAENLPYRRMVLPMAALTVVTFAAYWIYWFETKP